MSQTTKAYLQCGPLLLIFYVVTAWVMSEAMSASFHFDSDMQSYQLIILLLLSPIFFKFIVQVVSFPFYWIVENYRNQDQPFQAPSTVSVLIPAWNEQVGILKTLNSVVNSKYPHLEIVIVNDGSTDNTHSIINRFIDEYNQTDKSEQSTDRIIKYLKLSNGGKARALNQALLIASGEFVITLDADSVMDESMISNMIKRFSNSKVAAVAGNVIVGNRKKPIELLQQLEYLQGFWFKRADSMYNSVHIIGGAAAAYRKSAIDEIGGFDENIITEDVEISTRLLAQGYLTRYAADAAVYTEGPSDWRSLCSQRLRWKYGRLLTYIKHRSLFFSCDRQHNPYLTWLVLPIAIYAELVLLSEGLLLAFFYGYTFYTGNFFPLLSMISLVTILITLQIVFDTNTKFHSNLLLLAPIAWLLFYVIDLVEFQALCRSLHRLVKRKGLEWQTWSRVGIVSRSVERKVNHTELIS